MKLDFLDNYLSCKNVLVAPLNWGLGHATRMIPIIRYFVINGVNVVVASDGIASKLLKKEFPTLVHIELPGYNIKYSKHKTNLRIALQGNKVLLAAFEERQTVKGIVEQYDIDFIISDNRLGVRHPDVKSVIVTHQPQMISPLKLLQPVISTVTYLYLNQFDECWIPDYDDHRLSGKLSNPKGIDNYRFIGPLSRFNQIDARVKYDFVVVLSGPEPQRSILEDLILDTMVEIDCSYRLIRGTTQPLLDNAHYPDDVVNLADSKELELAFAESRFVITRTGYTSVMDLDALGKKAILIPTPGQDEQVYLGDHLAAHPNFSIVNQKVVVSKLSTVINQLLSQS